MQSPSNRALPRSGIVGLVAAIGAMLVLVTMLVLTTGHPSTTTSPAPPSSGATTRPAPDPGSPAPTTSPPLEPQPTPEQIRVAVTSTGVPVAVMEQTPSGHVVRTPCGGPVELDMLTSLDPVTVVVDPGHGGPIDTGTIGPNGLRESDLNLTVAQALASELEDRGIAAALTRTGDYAVPIQVRAGFAEAAGAAFMLSVHHNAPASAASAVPGTEVYVQSTSPESARLGGIVYEETMGALNQFDVAWTRRHDAGVLEVRLGDGRDAYGVLRLPVIPTVLVELGYLANPAEAAFFATDTYVGAAATAMADGVEAYLTTDRTGAGHMQPARTFTPGRSHAPDDCANPPLGD